MFRKQFKSKKSLLIFPQTTVQESKWDWGLQRWVTGRGDTKSGLVVTRLVDPQVDGAISLHHDKIKITLNV